MSVVYEKENENFLNKFTNRAEMEISKLFPKEGSDDPDNINHHMTNYIKILEDSINFIVNRLSTFNEETDNATRLDQTLESIAQSILILCKNGTLSPLTGDEDEWEDVISPSLLSTYDVRFHGKDFEYKINSLQRNKRLDVVYRYNKDNKMAFRKDLIVFHDVKDMNHGVITDESMELSKRFIQFPYFGEVVHETVVVDENGQIRAGVTTDMDDIGDKCYFYNPLTATGEYFAPRIPIDDAMKILEEEKES